jgi:hypothetical protein
MYPDVFILLRIIMTVPVVTAFAERSFFEAEIDKDLPPNNNGTGAIDGIGQSFKRGYRSFMAGLFRNLGFIQFHKKQRKLF